MPGTLGARRHIIPRPAKKSPRALQVGHAYVCVAHTQLKGPSKQNKKLLRISQPYIRINQITYSNNYLPRRPSNKQKQQCMSCVDLQIMCFCFQQFFYQLFQQFWLGGTHFANYGILETYVFGYIYIYTHMHNFCSLAPQLAPRGNLFLEEALFRGSVVAPSGESIFRNQIFPPHPPFHLIAGSPVTTRCPISAHASQPDLLTH